MISTTIINSTTDATPGAPSSGDTYLVGATPSGDWAGHAGEFASFYGLWLYRVPKDGDTYYDADAGTYHVRIAGSWEEVSST